MTDKTLGILSMCLALVVLTAAETADRNQKAAGVSDENAQVVISSLPDEIKLITGKSKNQHYAPRLRAIHALSSNLPRDQVQACYEFLYQKLDSQTLPNLQFNGLKNELVFVLMRQKRKPAELSGHLVKMYRDKSFDTTWRDYCVQFFGKWYPDAPKNSGRREMAEALWDALKNERGNSISGAASSQLCFLSGRFQEFDKKAVSEASYDALCDPKCANISRVALLQTCAVLGNEKALPVARKLASGSREPLLKASAIAAIGMLGSKDDLELLRQFERAKDIRLRAPAKAAVEKIEARIHPDR